MTPLLELRDVRAGYGKVEVLHGVDLQVRGGALVAVLGAPLAGQAGGHEASPDRSDRSDGSDRSDRPSSKTTRKTSARIHEWDSSIGRPRSAQRAAGGSQRSALLRRSQRRSVPAAGGPQSGCGREQPRG